ncbi:hypothetical protein CBS101457_002470 [Exobasidium rhododendri]|nr:hypothetical protein CBS101457_002470 [Exobasidium rhododendri]
MAPYLSNAEIKSLSKNLASAVSESRSQDARTILEQLQSGVQPVEDVIRATKIGQAVAKVRSYDDKGVSQLAKDLVRTWKSKVESQREAKKKESPNGTASPANAVTSPLPVNSAAANSHVPPSSSSSNRVDKKADTKQPLSFEIHDDKTRNACLKIIHVALEVESTDKHAVFARAKEVEEATFTLVGKGSVNNEYRQKMRSLSLNLKDRKNPELREGVASGLIEADKLVLMTPEEMASEEKKAERSALQMQNLFKAKAAAAQEAETDAFQCGKCKQRKCTYYQKQTRSFC